MPTSSLVCGLQCQAFVDELSASHSTDLQQRAYELQALLAFDSIVVSAILPVDASCEDIEVDRSLCFLNSYVQSMLSKGAKQYIPANERLQMGVSITWDNPHNDSAVSNHSLRFDPYEKPQLPSMAIAPVATFESEDFIIDRSGKPSQIAHQPPPGVDAVTPEASRLRLEGVQRKWGRPTYSGSSSVSSPAGVERSTNGSIAPDYDKDSGSKEHPVPQDSKYVGGKSKQLEVSAEKQKLAASLFGGVVAKADSSVKGSGRSQKQATANKHSPAKRVETAASVESRSQAPAPQPPDLLDFGVEEPSTVITSRDPMKDLEGLLDLTDTESSTQPDVPSTSLSSVDLKSLYDSNTGQETGMASSNNVVDLMASTAPSNYLGDNSSILEGLSGNLADLKIQGQVATAPRKGPSLETSLQKHARSRQVGVTPTGPNPDLFKDLLK
ncbi:hypothetical protein L7F22_052603 [Adiantum nelumboides]|nr:hypothetical protein [Adiantum nelumboides]